MKSYQKEFSSNRQNTHNFSKKISNFINENLT
jgi:hypothetical protein